MEESWIRKEGLDPARFRFNGRQLTAREIFMVCPVLLPFAMWGMPAGHLKQYRPFGGRLEPEWHKPLEHSYVLAP